VLIYIWKYTDDDYQAFRLLSANIEEGAAFGSEPFPGSFLGPLHKNISLSQDISLLLANFYCNTYNKNFVILSHLHNAPDGSIPILPKINQYSRLKIGTEVFGSTLSSQYAKSAKILARFIDSDDTSDTYSDQVQFFLNTLFICWKVLEHII
jgi:hypothetical protein